MSSTVAMHEHLPHRASQNQFGVYTHPGALCPTMLWPGITMDAGQRLTDLEERWWGGTATGAVFWILFLLANLHRELASGNNASKYAEALAGAHKRKEIPHGFMVGERSFSNRGAPLGCLGNPRAPNRGRGRLSNISDP